MKFRRDEVQKEPAMSINEQQIHHDLAALDKRVAVLETRAEITDARISTMNNKLDQITEMLADHIEDENNTKGKMLISGFTAASAALVAAIGTIASWILNHISSP